MFGKISNGHFQRGKLAYLAVLHAFPLDRSSKLELLIFVIAGERVEFRQGSSEKTENSRYEEIIQFEVRIAYDLK